ncbi:hypothetical protein D3C86_1508000 [compost metagenome]
MPATRFELLMRAVWAAEGILNRPSDLASITSERGDASVAEGDLATSPTAEVRVSVGKAPASHRYEGVRKLVNMLSAADAVRSANSQNVTKFGSRGGAVLSTKRLQRLKHQP